jgi:DNA polymerase-3 subunit gamma/tau
MNLPLHLKYRPQSLDEIYGNQTTVKSLRLILEENRVRTFLFHGIRGTGKTTLARIIAKTVGGTAMSIRELNLADTRGIDDAREIIALASQRSLDGGKNIFILDEIHRITVDAKDSLLKVIEEPPAGTYFVLCTTVPFKLEKTTLSRCVTYETKPLKMPVVEELILDVCAAEGVKDVSKAVIEKIATVSNGCPREILTNLEKVYKLDSEKEMLELLYGGEEESLVIDVARAIVAGKKWGEISKNLKTFDGEAEQARYLILNYLKSVLLNKRDARTASMMTYFIEPTYSSGRAGLVLACYLASQC